MTKEHVELLLKLKDTALKMRKAQKLYYQTSRDNAQVKQERLIQSKELEKEVDTILATLQTF